MTEDLSIIIPTYNHIDYIEGNLNSILAQKTQYSIKLYILDDASNDGSYEVIQKYQKRYPEKIKTYRSPKNLGSGKLSHYYHQPQIKGKYWCILEGDDQWNDEKKVEKQLNFLESNPDYTGCGSYTLAKNSATQKEYIISTDKNSFNLLDILTLDKKYRFYTHTSSIIWRNINKKLNEYLPKDFAKKSANGDFILMQMMLRNGKKMKVIPEIMSCYNINQNGLWSSLSKKKQNEINRRLKKDIRGLLPLKTKIYLWLNKKFLKGRYTFLKKFIPQTINN